MGLLDTNLSPEEEARYQRWVAQLPGALRSTDDYDLRGAFRADARAAANGHMPDTFKKPNHPTFSTESQYSTPDAPGGQWVEDGHGGWVFWASPTNVANRGTGGLLNYFSDAEPDAQLILPSDYRLPRRGLLEP